jgi:hypothetical protein
MADSHQPIKKGPLGFTAGIFNFTASVAFAVCLFPFTFNAQPRILAGETKKKFETVKKGAVVTKEFDIMNVGSEPLIIQRADVQCSCTTVDFPKAPIDPGKHATIKVVFNTASAYGRQDREAVIHSNDPKSPLKLRIKGMVLRK